MERLTFNVAAAYFCVFADDASYIKKLIPSFCPFFVHDLYEKPIMEMIVGYNLVNSNAEGKLISCFDCANGIYHIYLTETGYKITIHTLKDTLAGAMYCNTTFTECKLTLFGNLKEQSYALNNALMTAFTFSAAYHDIIMMHASVIMHSKRGYLFLGKSGTGKSTHSRLWLRSIPNSELLNDDNPAIRISKSGNIYVYGTPWSGKTACYKNSYVKVGAFIRLHQASKNSIKQDNKLSSFVSLLSSTSTMIWDKASYNHIIDTIEAIVKNVASYQLECLPNEEAAKQCYLTTAKPYEMQNS